MLQKCIWKAAVIALSGFAVACTSEQAPAPTEPPKASVQLRDNATLGHILTDSAGRTLYFYTRDTTGISVCNGGCLDNWPVFFVSAPTFGDGLNAADFGVVMHPNATPQLTYKGWPLYYYKNDAAAGEVKGENVGQVWYVAKPDYTVMFMNGRLIGNNGKQYTSDYVEGAEIVQYFTDAWGRTLYGFKTDRFQKNNYTKPDFSNNGTWPIYEADFVKAPSTLNAGDFSTISVFGRKQLTYKGWPLYYFGPDAQVRGKTKGVSVPQPGVWPVITAKTGIAPQ
ncbi:COG4315 family predicted lipoprotein [Chitinophaga lutea]